MIYLRKDISANPKGGKILCLVKPIEDSELLVVQLVTN